MKVFTPEISWHNRLPALSLDISGPIDDKGTLYRIATGGNDCRVYIWSYFLGKTSKDNAKEMSSVPDINIMAGLRRHQRSVGAVKFHPQEQMLASGDDDGYIYLWKHQPDNEPIESNAFLMNDDGFEDLETWQQQRVLRGHLEDICDLAWSKDGQYLLSGSVDNSAILWDAHKGSKVWHSDLIKGYVQGVAIDPHGQFLTAISSDRSLRIYNFLDKRLLYTVRQMHLKNNHKAFFCDDTVQTFCRRFEFSPDGQFLLAPTSRVVEKEPRESKEPVKPKGPEKQEAPETPEQENDFEEPKGYKENEKPINHEVPKKLPNAPPKCLTIRSGSPEVIEIDDSLSKEPTSPPPVEAPTSTLTPQQQPQPQPQPPVQITKPSPPINVVLVFRRSSLNKPVTYYPTGREVALCTRFSPVTYKLKDTNETNFWGLPYRLVFAIATSRSVIIYDSQQKSPIGYISQIHLARLTDLAWSGDGKLLMVSSYDGYSTLIHFDTDEFGEIHMGPLLSLPEPEPAVESIPSSELKTPTSTPPKRGQKRSLTPRDSEVPKKEKLAAEKPPESVTMWKYVVRASKPEGEK